VSIRSCELSANRATWHALWHRSRAQPMGQPRSHPCDSFAKDRRGKPATRSHRSGTTMFALIANQGDHTRPSSFTPRIGQPPCGTSTAATSRPLPAAHRGDRGRGCWQFNGAENIQVSDIVITGCHNAASTPRRVAITRLSKGIKLSNVVFRDNDNGLTGASQDRRSRSSIAIRHNGNLSAFGERALRTPFTSTEHLHPCATRMRHESHPGANSTSSSRCPSSNTTGSRVPKSYRAT